MLGLLDGLTGIVVIVGTIIILFKAIPLILKVSKTISDQKKEKDHLADKEQRGVEEISKINTSFSQVMDQLVNVKCPDCGEPFPPEDLRPVCYCSFCGKRIEIPENLLKDAMRYSNDEKNRQIELQKIQQAKRENTRHTAIFIVLLILIIGGLCIGLYHLWK